MPNAIKHEAGWVSRGTILTTELNSLAADTQSAVGSEINNATNLDTEAMAVIEVEFATSPAAGAGVTLWAVSAPDGTNYCDATSAKICDVVPCALNANDQRLETVTFKIGPGKTKFLLTNNGSTALESSGNQVTLFTNNLEIQ